MVAAKLQNLDTCILSDSGSGCSAFDLGTVHKISLQAYIDKRSPKSLINASGNSTKILEAVTIKVPLAGNQSRDHVFQVLASVTYSNVLLGSDFMSLFGTLKFNFATNTIHLDDLPPPPLSLSTLSSTLTRPRLSGNITLLRRTESVVFVKASKNKCDFTHRIKPRIPGFVCYKIPRDSKH